MNAQVESQLQIITKQIVEKFDPQMIIAFGSHVYGKPTPDSDVDLLIVMESNERPAKRASQISRLLRPRPFSLDILVCTPEEIQQRLQIGDYFIHEVLERGQVLYERGISESVGSQSRRRLHGSHYVSSRMQAPYSFMHRFYHTK